MKRWRTASRVAWVAIGLATFAWAQTPYWPLADGNSWELRAGDVNMRFEVTGHDGDTYHVNWHNPWVKSEFGLRAQPSRILLDTLNIGLGVAKLAAGTVYFDFAARQGEQWSNAAGAMTLLHRGIDVDTPGGSFHGCIEIRARDQRKTDTFWTFCPGAGPVRFGAGKSAFLLMSYYVAPANVAPEPRPRADAGRTPQESNLHRTGVKSESQRVGRMTLIGLDANPAASDGYSAESQMRRMQMAFEAGVSFLYLHPKWDELEISAGRYDFSEVDARIGIAEKFNLAVLLNIRAIDTNNRSVPVVYKHSSFGEPQMADRLGALMRALAAHTRGRVKWITIGNEVDQYLLHRKSEVDAYAQFLRRVIPVARETFPRAEVTVNFTYAGWIGCQQEYKPITEQMDLYSFTYYPLNVDMSFRPPDTVFADVGGMARAANGMSVIIQETGYASAPELNSSEQKQAQFIHNMFGALRQNPSVIGANFVWMSDLPDAAVSTLTRYYRAGNSAKFKAFLASLGYFDKENRPKPAWEAFRAEGRR